METPKDRYLQLGFQTSLAPQVSKLPQVGSDLSFSASRRLAREWDSCLVCLVDVEWG